MLRHVTTSLQRLSWSVAARATCLGIADVFSLTRTIQTRWDQYWHSSTIRATRRTTKTFWGRGYRYTSKHTLKERQEHHRCQNDCISHHILESWQHMRQSTVLLQELCQQFLESPHFNRNWRNWRTTQNKFWCLRHIIIQPEMISAECSLVASFCQANFSLAFPIAILFFLSRFWPSSSSYLRMTKPTGEDNTLVGDGAELDFGNILSADAQGEPSFHLVQCSSHQYTVLLYKNYLIPIDRQSVHCLSNLKHNLPLFKKNTGN